MSEKKLPEFASYSAGATRTKLKVFAEAERQGYGSSCLLYAKRGKVGKYEGRNSLFVFVNATCPASEAEVAVILEKGYGFAKSESSPCEPIIWSISSATCESGVLMVVPFGFEYLVYGYKNRRPPQYYRVTCEGIKNITDEVAAEKQVSI